MTIGSRLSKDLIILLSALVINTFVYDLKGQVLPKSSLAENLMNKPGIPAITSYHPRNYQGHPNNYSVIQDKEGVMYFGNLWGVIEFNGSFWRKIPLPNGSSCTSLAIDDSGTIFVGGRNEIGYLKKDSIGRNNYVSLNRLLPANIKNFDEVWKIFVTKDGIYFSSNSVLLYKDYSKEHIELIETSNNAFYENGQVYTSDYSGIYKVFKNKIQRLPNSGPLIGQFINMMGTVQGKTLISTSEKGMFLYDGNVLQHWDSEINKFLRNYNPQKIINVEDKVLIFCTELGGVFITDIEGRVVSNIDKSNGLSSNTITDIYLDKDRNLWLSLNNGIAQIEIFKEYSYINNYLGVSGIPYSSAVYDGKLYLATSEGLFYKKMDSSGTSTGFTKLQDFSGLVWNLQVIDNKLFCGHAITCQVIDHDKKAEMLYDAGSWRFLPISDTKILMGTYKGFGYLEKINNKWKYTSKIEGFEESSRYFVLDGFGDIWVSHGSKGVYQLRLNKGGDKVVKLKLHSSINNRKIGNNAVSKIGGEVVVATDFGVFKYDPESEKLIAHKGLTKALKENSGTTMIIKEDENRLWVIDQSGVLIKLEQDKNGEFNVIAKTEKFKSNLIKDFEHLNPLNAQTVIIGTQDGFVNYKPVTKKAATFQTYISKVETSDAKLLWQGYDTSPELIRKDLPFAQNSLKFYFTSNSYDDPLNHQFSYRLEGFNNDKWTDWSTINFKEYTNLDPGNYKLHVKSLSIEGTTGKESSVSFRILPPWYRTSWAYAVYIIFAATTGVLISVEVKKRFNRQRKRLELEKAKELWEKQKEWEADELKREKAIMELEQEKLYMESVTLRQKALLLEQEKEQERKIVEMQKEKLEAEILYKNNELSSLTLHITQKNELLAKIRYQSKKLKQDISNQESSETLQHIEQLIQKGLSTSKEWEKFTEHFNFIHNGFLQRLKQQYPDLKSNSLKLCAYLKMRLSSKQIAVLMNTAPASVMTARYRLRIKFNLEKDQSLEDYLNNF